jgi:hypothetical protein
MPRFFFDVRSVGASARAAPVGRRPPEPRCSQGVDLSEGHQKVAPPTSVSETPRPSYLAPLFRAGLFCELGGEASPAVAHVTVNKRRS